MIELLNQEELFIDYYAKKLLSTSMENSNLNDKPFSFSLTRLALKKYLDAVPSIQSYILLYRMLRYHNEEGSCSFLSKVAYHL
jgi:hypothetical protein